MTDADEFFLNLSNQRCQVLEGIIRFQEIDNKSLIRENEYLRKEISEIQWLFNQYKDQFNKIISCDKQQHTNKKSNSGN